MLVCVGAIQGLMHFCATNITIYSVYYSPVKLIVSLALLATVDRLQ